MGSHDYAQKNEKGSLYMTKPEKIIKRNDDLSSKNSNWNSYWQQLATFCLPRKAWIDSIKITGEQLKLKTVFDSTAMRSLKTMAAGFHSNLTNPSSKWFNLRTRDMALMDSKDVSVWFKEVEDVIFGTLNSSNFDTTMQEFYLNSGCFGTGSVLTLEDAKEKVRFTEIPIEQIMIEEDAYGRVNRMYRSFNMTVQQAFDRWGANAGEAVLDKLENKPNEDMKFLHYVGPREKTQAGKEDSINMPYESIWIEVSKKHLIGEGGFKEFPYAVGRFYKDTNDVFGYSPAMDALYEIKLINAQVRTMLRASMKQSDPALVVPRRGYVLPLNLNPGAVNYRDDKIASDSLTQIPSGGNLPITFEIVQAGKQDIKDSFFVPLFQAISNITHQMTIPEVQRRVAENMVLLGPVVGRFTQEVLDPIILRVFSILWDAGDIPEPPQELQDQEMDIVYISPLAKVQRTSEIYEMQAFMQDVGMIATAKQEVIDKIKGDTFVDELATIRGINPELLASDEEVSQIRQQRAEAMAQQQQQAQMAQAAQTADVGSKALKNVKEAEAVGETE